MAQYFNDRKIVNAMIYSCQRYNNDQECLCIFFLFKDGYLGIYKVKNKKWFESRFDKANIKRMWKNCGGSSSGVICQLEEGEENNTKLLYFTSKFLRELEFNEKRPYVRLI